MSLFPQLVVPSATRRKRILGSLRPARKNRMPSVQRVAQGEQRRRM
jgi:hypothetical protein